ncbi:uncharacterized protein VTP21DRAFT_2669 [Calcarisporiella thermophila]|uniref:uncharacterized protein n=1 Tax=Calcarisporiella thermophila TaxID=911321 RepID=UPI003742590B
MATNQALFLIDPSWGFKSVTLTMAGAVTASLLLLLSIQPFFRTPNTGKSSKQGVITKPTSRPQPSTLQNSKNFVKKMEEKNYNLIIFYGSQTGTAEDYAMRLAREAMQKYGLRVIVANVEDYDLRYLSQLRCLAIFVLATYGEGEPTDSAKEFWEIVCSEDSAFKGEEKERPLENLRYFIFGLGNRGYELFNECSRRVDKELQRWGATRLGSRGEGDDDSNLEEDFLTWKEEIWSILSKEMVLATLESDSSYSEQFIVKELSSEELEKTHVYHGELVDQNIKNQDINEYSAKRPFFAPISTRNLFSSTCSRVCIHGEIDLASSGMTYETGDHLGVWPLNPEEEVERLARALGLWSRVDQIITVRSKEGSGNKLYPFPSPSSYRTIFRHYLDICTIPSRQTICQLANFAPTDDAKNYLTNLGEKAEYTRRVKNSCLTLGQVLERASTQSFTGVPFSFIVENISRLQCRYYSISSSNMVSPNSPHIAAVALSYHPDGEPSRTVYGVGSNYLKKIFHHQNPNEPINFPNTPHYHITRTHNIVRIPVHIRQSTFKLPQDKSIPIIMVGPGTGAAPFRGFMQERALSAEKGEDVGPMLLFTGCRNKEQDFLYGDEWEQYFQHLPFSQVITAFSRDQPEKIYVQHRLYENATAVWNILSTKSGYFYVCGDAKSMAKEVNLTLVRIAQELGAMTQQEAMDWVKDLRSNGRYMEDVWS